MKQAITLPLITKTLALTGFAASMMFVANPSQAAILVNATESGGNVIFTGTGSLNINDSTLFITSSASPGIVPSSGYLTFGTLGITQVYLASGPSNFGSSSFRSQAGTGNLFGIYGGSHRGAPEILVPRGYTSGTILNGTQTFTGKTFASLGLTTGSYVWNLTGSNDTFTLNIGVPAAVPEPLTILGAMTAAGFGAGFKRKLAKSKKDQKDA